MNLLFRYVFRLFFTIFVLVSAAFAGIYLLVDFFERIDNFMEAKKGILVLQYFLLKTPLIVEQLTPITILLSGVIALGLLNNSRELQALKAAGIPLYSIVRPVFAGSLAVTLTVLFMAQWILPLTMSKTNEIWYVQVNAIVPLGINRNGRFYYRGKEGFYTFGRPDPKRSYYTDFIYTRWDKNYHFSEQIHAENASWENGTWRLAKGLAKAQSKGEIRSETFENRTFLFPESPASFFIPAYRETELSLAKLFQEAREKGDTSIWATFYGRLSYIFFGLPLLMAGLPILHLVYQRWGKDLTLAVPVSSGLAFVSWGWWSVLQALAKAAYLPPLVAAWSIHVTVGLMGLYMLRRIDRKA